MKRPMVVALVAMPMLCFGLTIGGASGVASAGTPIPGATNCPMFPADNVWNTPINNLPVNPDSAEWLAAMDASTTNLNFVNGPSYGMPITVVPAGQPFVNITFTSPGYNDPGPYPFGPNTAIEQGSGDRHAIMVDPANCLDYELYDANYSSSGSTAANGVVWNLNSNALLDNAPGAEDTVDASGLPIVAGLARLDEVDNGVITHALRMQAADTEKSYIWPATAGEGSTTNPDLPPMGARFRLKASFNISGFSPQVQVILRALQTYGLIVADNGPNWHFYGDADPNWPTSVELALATVPASAFEAVDESSLEISPESGQARQLGVSSNCTSQPGYRLVASDGGLFSFCEPFLGSMGGQHLNAPIVGMATTSGGNGYWQVGSDGGIFNFGNASFNGSTGGMHLNAPIVGMAATPDGGGYWLVASDGGIFAYGDAGFYGSAGSLHLNKPIVGMAATHDGKGYWLVASDGGIFAYGDAGFYGSVGSVHLNKPVVGMAATPDGGGYWLVASDGGIFNYGDAAFDGSAGSIALNEPIVGMEANPSGGGYWLVASDGGIFNYGGAGFYGSTGGTVLNAPIVGIG
jgi:hypothetical protein